MRNRVIIPTHLLVWVALWGFWVFVSRDNHPDLRLKIIASGLLVLTFAVTVYANHLWLIPQFWSSSRFAAYAAALLIVMGSLALACTAAIHHVYDVLWGPDPARFGFLTNLGMEFTLVAFHVLAVAVGVRLFGSRAIRPVAS